MSFLLTRSPGRQSLRSGLTDATTENKASLLNTIVGYCLTASIGKSGLSGKSGRSGMSGKSGMSGRPSVVRTSSFRTKSFETVLLKQFFSNSASQTVLLKQCFFCCRIRTSGMSGMSGKSGMSGRPFVVRTSSFRTKSSETVLLKQFFSNSAS